MCENNNSTSNREPQKNNEDISVDKVMIWQLTMLTDQYQKHLKCLQKVGMCTYEKKEKLFLEIDRLFSIISNCTSYSDNVSK